MPLILFFVPVVRYFAGVLSPLLRAAALDTRRWLEVRTASVALSAAGRMLLPLSVQVLARTVRQVQERSGLGASSTSAVPCMLGCVRPGCCYK